MHIKRYIITGTPGSGKTSTLHALKDLGYNVIPEAATDIIRSSQKKGILEPWTHPHFIDETIHLQKQRQYEARGTVQFYDRSPLCTYALSRYLGYPPSPVLVAEVKRILSDRIYHPQVFFFENLGFIENTDARQISFEEALVFEKMHIEVYKKFGFEILFIPKMPPQDRCDFIVRHM